MVAALAALRSSEEKRDDDGYDAKQRNKLPFSQADHWIAPTRLRELTGNAGRRGACRMLSLRTKDHLVLGPGLNRPEWSIPCIRKSFGPTARSNPGTWESDGVIGEATAKVPAAADGCHRPGYQMCSHDALSWRFG